MTGRPDLARRLAAEALGAFCLVFAGTGAVVVNAVAGDPLGHGGVAAAFGLAVAIIVILAVATDTRAVGSLAALAIGGTIALEALVMGPITGASMNPARSLAPALVAAGGADLWLYLVGPVLGALAGTAIYQFLRDARDTIPAAAPAALIEHEEALP